MGRVWGESKNLTHLQLRAARRWAANRRILNHHSRVEVAGRPAGGDAPKRARQSRRRSSMEAHGHATAMQNDGATAPFILRRRRRSHQHDTDETRRNAMRPPHRSRVQGPLRAWLLSRRIGRWRAHPTKRHVLLLKRRASGAGPAGRLGYFLS